ncbi:MAG TPA: FAD-binding oxidoreductase [Euzebyales bacterium]
MPPAILAGWGRTTASASQVVRPPADADAAPPDDPRGVVARGSGRSYGDAAQNAGGVVVAMRARHRLHAFDAAAGTVRVDAGITLDELLRAVVPHGWFLPVVPGTRMITVGGAIAADVHGKNHVAAGSLRRHLRGFTLLLADGTRRWVTPDDHEVFAATLGGMGLTGIVLDAELTLRRIATAWVRARTTVTTDLAATIAALDAADDEYRIATLDLGQAGPRMGRAIVETATHASVDDLTDREPGLTAYGPRAPVTVPDAVPPGLLNRLSARMLNAVWFARAPRRPRVHLVDLPTFFHPLDAVGHWNRLYGPRGFVQYQFAVPLGHEDALARVAQRLAADPCPTFVVVLKRLGPGGGMLSFPQEGWTLAADIPAGTAGLARLLDTCDDDVCEAGGRVYLAKDGRLRADRMPVMYPELDRWRQVRDRIDPTGRWRSDLGRRLGLCTS